MGAVCGLHRIFPALLKRLGHDGISIFHGGADRAVLSSLERKFRQLHATYFDEEHGVGKSGPLYLVFLLDWEVYTGCCLHDVQNSLKWSVSPFTGGEVLHDCHIVIESLRNSFTLVVAHMCPFLRQHLVFSEEPFHGPDVHEYWSMLGIPDKHIDMFVSAHLRFEGGSLLTALELEEGTTIDKISFCLMVIFKFRSFKSSRWCAARPSCGALLAGLSVGLKALVNMTRADKTAIPSVAKKTSARYHRGHSRTK
jgi:hypothetical protein